MKRERRESSWRGLKERVRMRGRGLSEDYGSRACSGGETSWGRMAEGSTCAKGNRSMFGVVCAHVLQSINVTCHGHRASTRVKNNIPFHCYQIVHQAARSSVAATMAVRLAACRKSR